MRPLKLCGFALLCTGSLLAASTYYRHVLFDNSNTPDSYFYSKGTVSAPSQLTLQGARLPVDTEHFHSPPNALRLQWTSDPNGGWQAEISLYKFRNRNPTFIGDQLVFWCYTPDAEPFPLPSLALRDNAGNFTPPLDLKRYAPKIPAGKWFSLAIPMNAFASASLRPFDFHQTAALVFVQSTADDRAHTLTVDDIRIEPNVADQTTTLRVVSDVHAKGYERHIDLSWKPAQEDTFDHYIIYRSTGGGPFVPIAIQTPDFHRYEDFLGRSGETRRYQVRTVDNNWHESAPSKIAEATTRPMTDDELLTMVQEVCFRYYWEGAHPGSGMTRENLPGEDKVVATGASGFGIMALVVGVDRGFISRAEALGRLERITSYLNKADRFHGVWPHFTDGETGRRIPVFGMLENGADLVETSFLMEGLLTARQYFNGPTQQERALYRTITDLWQSVEWDWFRRTPDGDALLWHWSPEYTWAINHRLTGYNETMITYLEAIASPTHGVPASLYYTGWAGQSKKAVAYRQGFGQQTAGDHYTNGQAYEGIKLDVGVGEGGPLFFTHYSFLGFDPHVRDRFTDYFQNSRNQALINRAYCIRNPGGYKGYGPNCWGITAVDGPKGYQAYEPRPRDDDGTIAPTGAIASMPYTPEASMKALKFYYRELGDRLWGPYGFRDAFNLQENWFSGIYMGLNQAPMVIMIENYRTGLVWRKFMANPEIGGMVGKVGFERTATSPVQ